MGSSQRGFWELREQPRAKLGIEAKCIQVDTAHMGHGGRRAREEGEGRQK